MAVAIQRGNAAAFLGSIGDESQNCSFAVVFGVLGAGCCFIVVFYF